MKIGHAILLDCLYMVFYQCDMYTIVYIGYRVICLKIEFGRNIFLFLEILHGWEFETFNFKCSIHLERL